MTTEEYHRQAGMSEDYNRLRAEYAALDGKYKTATIVCEDLLRELDNISHVHWDDMTHEDFVHWARSRARFAIDQGERKLGRPGLYNEPPSKTPITDSLKATLDPLDAIAKAKGDEMVEQLAKAQADALNEVVEHLAGPTLIGRSGAEIIEEENAKLKPIVGDIKAHAAEAIKHGPRAREERESAMPLPCPFCGCKRIMVRSADENAMMYCECDPNQGGCGARSGPQGCSTVKAAIARWNKRT